MDLANCVTTPFESDGSVLSIWSHPRTYRLSGHVTLTGKPKRGYPTAEAAMDRDLWSVYQCGECSLWHRAKKWDGYT